VILADDEELLLLALPPPLPHAAKPIVTTPNAATVAKNLFLFIILISLSNDYWLSELGTFLI
jgi:hypothetical protein